MNFAIILSGGSGLRFSSELPKQFTKINNSTILEHCILNFNNNILIDKIIVVSAKQYIEKTKSILNTSQCSKIVSIIEGGETRTASCFNGLKEILLHITGTSPNNVLIQDAARPNTSNQLIKRVVSKLNVNKAVLPAVPSSDTTYIADSDNNILDILDRTRLFKAQTPQAFNFKYIYEAYLELYVKDNLSFTDDISLFRKFYPYEHIAIVEGDHTNIKITYPTDIDQFKLLLGQ